MKLDLHGVRGGLSTGSMVSNALLHRSSVEFTQVTIYKIHGIGAVDFTTELFYLRLFQRAMVAFALLAANYCIQLLLISERWVV